MANGETFTNVDEAARYIISLGIEFAGTATPPGPYPIRLLDGTIKTVPNTEALLALASEISASPETDPRYFAPPKKETPKEPFKRSALAQRAIDEYAQAGGEGTWTGPNPDTGMYTFTIDTPEGDEVVGDPVTEQGLLQATFHPAAAYFEDYAAVEQSIRVLQDEGEGWDIKRNLDGTFDVITDEGGSPETVSADDLLAAAGASAEDDVARGAATGGLPRPKAPFPPDAPWPPMEENLQTGLMQIDGAAVSRYYSDFGIEGQVGKFAGFTESEADARVAELGPGHEKSYIPNLDRWMVTPKEEAPFAGFTESEADARLRELGPDYEKFYDSATNRFVVDLKPTLSWGDRIDSMFEEALRTGNPIDIDRILALDSLRDQISAKRMTPERAFELAAPIMQNPQHLSEMMSSLLSDTGQQLPQNDFQNLVTNYGGQTQVAPTFSFTAPTEYSALLPAAAPPPTTQQPNGLAAELGVPSPQTPEETSRQFAADDPDGDIGTQLRNGLADRLRPQRMSPAEIATGAAGRQMPREPMSPAELASGAAGRVLQPEEYYRPGAAGSRDPVTAARQRANALESQLQTAEYFPPDVAGRDTGDMVSPTTNPVVQAMNKRAQLLNQLGLTSEQWDAMSFEQQIEAAGMEIAASQTGSFADYVRNPKKYLAQAAADLNSINSQLQSAKAPLPSDVIEGAYVPQRVRAGAGMRTAEQENRLQQLLYQHEQALQRGKGTPGVAVQQIRQLDALRPHNALQAGLGYGGQEAAFGGTPFFPVHQGRSARGVFQEKGTRLWNEAQQRKFKASPVRRTTFG